MKDLADKTPQKPMSIEQAGNFLDTEMTDEKQLKRIQDIEKPITIAPEQDRRKFLDYAVSLLTTSRDREYKTLLKMRIMGYSTMKIAEQFGVKTDVVDMLEKQAIKIVTDVIRAKRETAIPIIGGLH